MARIAYRISDITHQSAYRFYPTLPSNGNIPCRRLRSNSLKHRMSVAVMDLT